MAEITDGELEALRARLAAAERVCAMYGWTAVRDESDRDKACGELWREWSDLPGVSPHPAAHPDLDDDQIAELAGRRDARRELALKAAARIICSHQPTCADMTEHAAVLEGAAT